MNRAGFARRAVDARFVGPALAAWLVAGAPAHTHARSNGVGPDAPAALDETERRAAARALFEEGLAHADARRWGAAADRFERAHALQPTPEIAYNLSTSLVRVGRLVKASEVLRGIADNARASAEVRRAASARLAEVRPRLAQLVIAVPALPEDARVRLDGRPLERAMLGVPLPADPGLHFIDVQADGEELARTTAALQEGARQTVTVRLPVTRPEARTRGSGRGPWFWTAVGAAALGVGAGVAAALAAQPDNVRGNVDTWRIGK